MVPWGYGGCCYGPGYGYSGGTAIIWIIVILIILYAVYKYNNNGFYNR